MPNRTRCHLEARRVITSMPYKVLSDMRRPICRKRDSQVSESEDTRSSTELSRLEAAENSAVGPVFKWRPGMMLRDEWRKTGPSHPATESRKPWDAPTRVLSHHGLPSKSQRQECNAKEVSQESHRIVNSGVTHESSQAELHFEISRGLGGCQGLD
ncbi:hypothetical protein BDR22DRAFT_889559 [Usnea florida]